MFYKLLRLKNPSSAEILKWAQRLVTSCVFNSVVFCSTNWIEWLPNAAADGEAISTRRATVNISLARTYLFNIKIFMRYHFLQLRVQFSELDSSRFRCADLIQSLCIWDPWTIFFIRRALMQPPTVSKDPGALVYLFLSAVLAGERSGDVAIATGLNSTYSNVH